MNISLRLSIRIALYCLLVGAFAVGGVTAEPALFPERQAETERQSATEHNETENRLRIEVKPNGSAVVIVSYRTRLDDANVTTAFERLQADIRTDPARYSQRFVERMTEAAATAEVQTGREMVIENMSVHATRRGPDLGVVTYTFVWRGFAATNGERLSVDETLDGFILYNGSRLTVTWPDSYEPITVRPTPDERRSNAVVWTAPTTFGGNEPRIVLSASNTDTNSSESGADPDEAVPSSDTGLPFPLADTTLATLAVLLVVAVVLTGAYAIRYLSDDGIVADADTVGTNTEAGRGIDATNGGLTGVVEAKTDDTPESTSDEVDDSESNATELLSNEENVLRVLEQHGGRMKQQQVVAALGWTEAKTSQVVSSLRAEGKVEGFRLGRENILSVPDDTNEIDASSDNST